MRERWAAEGAATEMCISVTRLVCGYLLDRSNAVKKILRVIKDRGVRPKGVDCPERVRAAVLVSWI